MPATKNLALLLAAVALLAAGYVLSGGAGPGPGEIGDGSWEAVERAGDGAAGDEDLTGPKGAGESRVELVDPVRDVEVPEGTAPGTGSTVIYPLEVELTMLLPGSVDVPDDVMSIGADATAGLEGSLIAAGGEPVRGTVEFLHGPNAGRLLQSDGAGRFGASDLLQGASIVKVTTADGSTAVREVLLAQLSTSELHVSFASLASVSGTITDEAGTPVEAAEVRTDGRVTYSDADGVFTFSSVPAGKVLVTARREGYATTRRTVGVGFRQPVRARDFKIALGESASLELKMARALGSAEPGLAILSPASGLELTVGGGFPWYEINPVRVPQRGSVVLEGLPVGAVAVRLFKDGALAVPPSKNVRLYAGRSIAAVIDLEPAPAIRGVVLDDGSPVKGARVTIEAADRTTVTSKVLGQRNPRSSLQSVLPSVPAAFQRTRTDRRGEFRFSPHPAAPSAYYVTATTKDGSRKGVGVVPVGAEEVTVLLGPAEVLTGAVELQLPGRFQGLPVDVRIQGAPQERRMLGAGQELEVEDLERGTWRLSASWRGAQVVPGAVVEIGVAPASVRGKLPPGAIQGQTADERRRARGS